jgi:hypothetical protein
VSETEPTVSIPAPKLWERLARIQPFPHFSEEQQKNFNNA